MISIQEELILQLQNHNREIESKTHFYQKLDNPNNGGNDYENHNLSIYLNSTHLTSNLTDLILNDQNALGGL